ncbi:hypothetical protein C1645_742824 [Glomus cerebriforme]|uniref:HCP-like protein n=1 Tax=Glomus cerebriforme TaxID=658196 RepID=A0A397SLS1_9GLOM|nr:hypothetical protein C1645_742824 [Glomus cerebriforme]
MSNNFDDNNNKNFDNFHNNLENNISSSNSENIINYELTTNSPLITKFFKELLQELYTFLINMEAFYINENFHLYEITNNYLLDYELDPKDVLEIMTSNSQNIFYYSSLIGYFYQYGIGCKVNNDKALEIFTNAIKTTTRFSFNQKNDVMTELTDDITKLNETILQYYYSLFLYKDVIIRRKNNYKFNIKNAEKGDPISQFYIGNCYYYGINVQTDYNKIFEWYSRSSKGGNIRAMYKLGNCYNYGIGVIKEKKKAFKFYLKSASEKFANASFMIGDCYRQGNGILKDGNKAFEWYLIAAEKGHRSSQYIVANYYISKCEEKWFYWNRKAAINGEINAQYKLAEYYLDNLINKNESKAFKWYLKLANQNKLKAVYLVAKCYRDGIGTEKNLNEATKWIEKYVSLYAYKKPPITINDFLNGNGLWEDGFIQNVEKSLREDELSKMERGEYEGVEYNSLKGTDIRNVMKGQAIFETSFETKDTFCVIVSKY